MASAELAVSVANSTGLKNGASAPYSCAILIISSSSVETMYRVIYLLFRASYIVYAINGFPQIGLIFFFGTDFDPPRARVELRSV